MVEPPPLDHAAPGGRIARRHALLINPFWRRRALDPRAVLPYLGMSYLYKRSNRFWHLLIKHDLVHTTWRPLVEWTRLRHVRSRRRLLASTSGSLISAGV